MTTRTAWAACLVLTGLTSASLAWSYLSEPPGASARGHAGSPADDLQRTLLTDNIGRPGDSVLSAMFVDIAARHFEGRLAPLPVRWEPGLDRVGALDGRNSSLHGMFGAAGSHAVILLNPAIQDDRDAVVRALCHEMVHAYLHTIGADSITHGPVFQAELGRLSEEGAFTGIVSDPDERRRVRAWLDAESARLDAERAALDAAGDDITRDRAAIEHTLNGESAGGRSTADAATMAARLDAHNQRAMIANARAARFNRDLDLFRAEVDRYNLMVVYPDGRDGDAPFRTPPAAAKHPSQAAADARRLSGTRTPPSP